MKHALRLSALALCALSLGAVETKTWSLRGQEDFEKAMRKGIELRSDGLMTLAPAVVELFDATNPHLWAMTRSGGSVYVAGGGQGGSAVRIFEVDSAGKGSVFAEVEGLEIHALAADSKGNLFAATAPDGKIWRIGADRKPVVFYEPKVKYIWSLIFDSRGTLYAATGDPAEIHRVSPAGNGEVVCQLEDTHARSMALAKSGDLIVGTEPSGLILRVSPAGQSFILYQSQKREVTSVATGREGEIYASATGTKGAAPVLTAPPAPTASPVLSGTAQARPVPVVSSPILPVLTGSGITGGSELIEIDAEGVPRVVWSHPQEIVYSLALDKTGHPLLATGNQGHIYRVESPIEWSLLATVSSGQVTALLAGPDGAVYAAASNVGKVFRLGPERESTGSVESEVFDAGGFTYWGRLNPDTAGSEGSILFETRSGNVGRPQKSWSAWEPSKDGRIVSPPARFLQWRAILTKESSGSPSLFGTDVAWMAKNLPPQLEEIEPTPLNYRFPASSTSSTSPKALTLPAMGKRSKTASVSLDSSSSATLSYSKGTAGVRWMAKDPNGDALEYRVEIRGAGESAWKLLKDRVRDRFLSFDSTAFPDGDYVIRVTASDAPDNTPADTLTGKLDSPAFLIDNTSPKIEDLSAQPAGGRVQVRFRATDDSSWLTRAEYSVNGVDWLVVEPASKLSDSKALAYDLLIDRPQPGELSIAVRVADEFDNQAVAKVVVR